MCTKIKVYLHDYRMLPNLEHLNEYVRCLKVRK